MRVTDTSGCSIADSVRIRSIEPIPRKVLPADTFLCPGYSFKITPLHAYRKFLWQDGSQSPDFLVTSASRYILQATSFAGCVGSDSIDVKAGNDCNSAIYFLNAFTPNGDGKNDHYRPKVWGLLHQYQLVIYNRLGNMVFKLNNPLDAWDGRVACKPQDAGTFAWHCKYQLAGSVPTFENGVLMLFM